MATMGEAAKRLQTCTSTFEYSKISMKDKKEGLQKWLRCNFKVELQMVAQRMPLSKQMMSRYVILL